MNKKSLQNVMLDNAILKTNSFGLAQKFSTAMDIEHIHKN